MSREAMKLALEAAYLAGWNASGEGYNAEYPFGDHARNPEEDAVWVRDRDNALREALAEQPAQQALDKMAENARELGIQMQPAQQEPVLQDIEQYRLQMAGICTAAIGYWKEGDGIHPDYDTVALRDVAKLYAKYDELYRAQSAQRTWVGLTDEEKRQIFEREDYQGWLDYINAIEAKLRSKNT